LARRKSRTLTEVELQFMQVIWSADEEVSTEDVRAALERQGRPLSGGSIRKVLSILVRKGYVSRRPEGRGFLYGAEVPEEQASRKLVLDLLRRAFDGSAALMVASLLDTKAVKAHDIEQIKKLIAEREREAQK